MQSLSDVIGQRSSYKRALSYKKVYMRFSCVHACMRIRTIPKKWSGLPPRVRRPCSQFTIGKWVRPARALSNALANNFFVLYYKFMAHVTNIQAMFAELYFLSIHNCLWPCLKPFFYSYLCFAHRPLLPLLKRHHCFLAI